MQKLLIRRSISIHLALSHRRVRKYSAKRSELYNYSGRAGVGRGRAGLGAEVGDAAGFTSGKAVLDEFELLPETLGFFSSFGVEA